MKRTITTVLLLIALLFGFTACEGAFRDPGMDDMDGGGYGGGYGGGMSFRGGNPSNADLGKVGLNGSQFTAINRSAGGGYKGYYVASPSGRSAARSAESSERATYQGSYQGAVFYALWENRKEGNFKSLILEIEKQTGVKCVLAIDWDDPDWFTEFLAEYGDSSEDGEQGFKFSDWYMAVGMNVDQKTTYKMWYLVWAKNTIKYDGANFRKGDMMWVFMDLSGYVGGDGELDW